MNAWGSRFIPVVLLCALLAACGSFKGQSAFLWPAVEDALRSGVVVPTDTGPGGPVTDSLAPIPGGGGTITPSAVAMTTLTLSWTKATDDVTPQAGLEYQVYRSGTNNIGSVALAGAGNVSAYAMVSQSTLPDMDLYEVLWKFNDLTDSSGHSHTLTNAGAAFTMNRASTPAAAYDVTGGGSAQIANTADLNFTNEITISAWVYITGSPATDQKLVVRLNGACTRGYSFGVQFSKLYPEVFDSVGTRYWYQDGANTLSANQWYHVVMTWKTGGQLRTYLNGSLDRSLAAGPNPIGLVNDGESFTFGSGTDGTSYPWLGVIDDVRIYARELSPIEVLYLYGLPAD